MTTNDFAFKNINIEKIIAHTIKAKAASDSNVEPITSTQLVNLDSESKTLFTVRLSDSLGNTSHGVQMDIERNTPADPIHLCGEMLHDSNNFIDHSITLAKKLQQAHTNASWPGGIMFVLEGTIGVADQKFIAIIKAETENGIRVVNTDGIIQLQVIKDLLLSKHQKLYKVAMVIQNAQLALNDEKVYDSTSFLCFLFDHTLTRLETKKAAAYFYSTFMGMSIRKSDAKYTEIFFNETQQYINNNNSFTQEDKRTYREALRTALKDNTPSIHIEDFADKTFPDDSKDDYLSHMDSKDFPKRAVVKDIDYIKKRLRKPRTTTMTSGVKILIPSDKEPKDVLETVKVTNGKTTFIIDGIIQTED